MKKCWIDDMDSRPTFRGLKEEFDDIISHEQRYNYLPLEGEIVEAMESAAPATHPTACSDSGQES